MHNNSVTQHFTLLLPPAQTDEEYRDKYLSVVDSTTLPRSFTFFSRLRNDVDQELDWRKKGFVSEVSVMKMTLKYNSSKNLMYNNIYASKV